MSIFKKKILLVSSAFYPEISPRSFRATELAKELFRQGHEVTVISKFRDFDYSEFLYTYSISFKMLSKPFFSQFPAFKRKPFSFISRLVNRFLLLLFEYPGIQEMFQVRNMLNNEKGYDLMISFAVPYPVHWGVAWARSTKMPIAHKWVADCGDPYMFARLDSFRKPFYFRFFEKNFSRKCDYISVPIKEMMQQFYSEFHGKIKVIPQGFDFSEIKLNNGEINNIIPIFIYAGSIIPGKRDLKLLMEFLCTMEKDFLFIVYTNQYDWYSPYKAKLGSQLELRSYIPRLKLIYEMSKVDFLVNIDTSLDLDSKVKAVPSKLIDYALANRPILSLNSGNLDKQLILEFFERNYARQRLVETLNYDIRTVASKFLELSELN